MKKIEKVTYVYNLNELSDPAKEKAFYELREDVEDYGNYLSDVCYTIEKIADAMNCRYSCKTYDGEKFFVFLDTKVPVGNLMGKRAYAYIVNNYLNPNKRYKKYWGDFRYENGKMKCKNRTSNIFYSWEDCPFTGFYADYAFSDAIKEFNEKFNKHSSVTDFIWMVSEKLGEVLTNEYKELSSKEFLEEHAFINDIYFLEDGSIYRG